MEICQDQQGTGVPLEVNRVLSSIKDTIQDMMQQYDIQYLNAHAIDLAPNGFIGPHIDSVKFSGKIVAGLSLGSPRLMELAHCEEEANLEPKSLRENHASSIEIPLHPRSLYILTDVLRYNYTHQIYAEPLNRHDDNRFVNINAKGDKKIQEEEEEEEEEPPHYRYPGSTDYSEEFLDCSGDARTNRRLSIIFRDVL